MSTGALAHIPADELWARWRDDIERITKDSYELFAMRRQFREIGSMFDQNSRLQSVGSNLWQWLRLWYASTVLMRFRREIDGQANTVNLRTLIEEIEKRPDVVTRRRIAERSSRVDPLVVHMIDANFTALWALPNATGSADDQIDPQKVRAHRLALEEATAELEKVANRTIAHRTREQPTQTRVEGADRIFELFELLLKKYLGLIIGSDLVKVEPTPQYDTMEVFTFPWHPRAYENWLRLTAREPGGSR
jgi:hypothetical protein